jgi:iron complex transport system substrate-binding protein
MSRCILLALMFVGCISSTFVRAQAWTKAEAPSREIRGRPGWQAVPAVVQNKIFEIKSPLISQPGPASLTDGLDAIRAALRQ